MAELSAIQSSRDGQCLPYTPERFFNAGDFSSQTAFHNHALDAILTATSHQEIIYKVIPPARGESVVTFLDEEAEHTNATKHYNSVTRTFWARVLSTEIHGCLFEWAVDEMVNWVLSGLLPSDERRDLHIQGSTTIRSFLPSYASSRKEPNLNFRPGNQRFPSIVMETGWSESIPRIRDDINVWLLGGKEFVKAVLIVEWHRIRDSDAIGGNAELYTLDDTNTSPILRQEETIFPAPPPGQAQNQEIRLTRSMLFGGISTQGRNPDDVFTLSLERLRDAARLSLSFMDLTAA